MENIVIGFFNIIKIIKAEGKFKQEDLRSLIKIKITGSVEFMDKFDLILSFLFNYGFFVIIHGVFIMKIFAIPSITKSFILMSFIPLFISHLISYKTNFIDKGEYLKISPAGLLNHPYTRIVVMHLTILFGGVVANGLGNPLPALLIMIILKIILDLYFHNKEHQKFNNTVSI